MQCSSTFSHRQVSKGLLWENCMMCLCDSKQFKITLLTQITPWFPIIPFKLLTMAGKACVWLLFACLAFAHLSEPSAQHTRHTGLLFPATPTSFLPQGLCPSPSLELTLPPKVPWLVINATSSKRPSLITLSGSHLFPPSALARQHQSRPHF